MKLNPIPFFFLAFWSLVSFLIWGTLHAVLITLAVCLGVILAITFLWT